jgi:hypothetical protein
MLFDIMEQHFNRNVGRLESRVKSFGEVNRKIRTSSGLRRAAASACAAFDEELQPLGVRLQLTPH